MEAETISGYVKAEVSWNLNWSGRRVWSKLIGGIKNADFLRTSDVHADSQRISCV